MAKPRRYTWLKVKDSSGYSTRDRYLEVKVGTLKGAQTYSIIFGDGQPAHINAIIKSIRDTLSYKSYIKKIDISSDGDKIQFSLDDGVSFDIGMQQKLNEIIQGELDAYLAKNPTTSQTTSTTTAAPTSSSSNITLSEDFLDFFKKITIRDVLQRLNWSDGLKDSMETDFVNSGYFYLGRLVKGNKQDTSKSIQGNVDGFASGKNTYLQANMIADEMFKMYEESKSSKSSATQTQEATQPNVSEPIYGIIKWGDFKGELAEIIKPLGDETEEQDFDYQCKIKGVLYNVSRSSFIVQGDVVRTRIGLTLGSDYKIVSLKNNQTIKLESKSGSEVNWNIGGFNWKEGIIEIREFYNLHELFKSKQTTQSVSGQPAAPEKSLSDDEKMIEALKKDVANLIFLKSTFSPVEFEETIKVGQKIDNKQKQINDLNLVIVDKKLKGNKIFDDLFEQSFTPIKNNYDVYAESETEGGDFFSPNGQKSNLKESISSIIRTTLFKEWFGDWQLAYNYRDIPNSGVECSKVIGENFEPLIVWHGTGAEFSYFRFDNFPAAYFAVNKDYSEWFANMQSGGGEGYTMPFFLNLRNPLDLTKFKTKEIDAKDFFDYMFVMTGMTPQELEVNPIFLDPSLPKVQTWVFLRNNPKMLKKLADSHVYDGIHFYETNPSVPEGQPAHVTEAYITFKPESCKIADPDRGDLILASMKSFLLEKGGKI